MKSYYGYSTTSMDRIMALEEAGSVVGGTYLFSTYSYNANMPIYSIHRQYAKQA